MNARPGKIPARAHQGRRRLVASFPGNCPRCSPERQFGQPSSAGKQSRSHVRTRFFLHSPSFSNLLGPSSPIIGTFVEKGVGGITHGTHGQRRQKELLFLTSVRIGYQRFRLTVPWLRSRMQSPGQNNLPGRQVGPPLESRGSRSGLTGDLSPHEGGQSIGSPIGFWQADSRVGHREMLSEMLTVGGDQPANVLALVSKSFQQRPRYRMKISEIDQRLRKPGA